MPRSIVLFPTPPNAMFGIMFGIAGLAIMLGNLFCMLGKVLVDVGTGMFGYLFIMLGIVLPITPMPAWQSRIRPISSFLDSNTNGKQ